MPDRLPKVISCIEPPPASLDREIRKEWVATHANIIPTNEAIQFLTAYSPFVEVGAGTGYWAYLIAQAGGDIIAYDKYPWTHTWCTVIQDSTTVAAKHPDRTLFLCYPPPEEFVAYRMLAAHLNAGGECLAYAGDGENGNDADIHFWRLLNGFGKHSAAMHQTQTVPVEHWEGTKAELRIYKRCS